MKVDIRHSRSHSKSLACQFHRSSRWQRRRRNLLSTTIDGLFVSACKQLLCFSDARVHVAVCDDLILELDPINPQTAARFVPPLGRWRRIEAGRAAIMREQLERIAAAPSLSRDTFEQVSRSLG